MRDIVRNRRLSFLIVEDNDLDLEKINRGFSRLEIQHQTIHAKDGVDALNVLRGEGGRDVPESNCVVLLDLNMPKMNGFEFLAALRADLRVSKTPVFVLTTSERQVDIDQAYEHGVCGYIVKPIEVSQMHEALSTLDAYWNLSKMPSGAVFDA